MYLSISFGAGGGGGWGDSKNRRIADFELPDDKL